MPVGRHVRRALRDCTGSWQSGFLSAKSCPDGFLFLDLDLAILRDEAQSLHTQASYRCKPHTYPSVTRGKDSLHKKDP